MRTAKLTDKGQITLPADALRAMNAGRGTEFLVIQEGERLVLLKAAAVGRKALDDLGGWEALAAPVFHDLWSTEEDDAWDAA